MAGPQAAAHILKELRKEQGWSWKALASILKSLAQQLGIERVASAGTTSIERTIARWESGDYRYKPDERYQLLLAHAYAASGRNAGLGPASDFDRLMAAFAAMGIPAARQDVLRALVLAAATVGGGALPHLG